MQRAREHGVGTPTRTDDDVLACLGHGHAPPTARGCYAHKLYLTHSEAAKASVLLTREPTTRFQIGAVFTTDDMCEQPVDDSMKRVRNTYLDVVIQQFDHYRCRPERPRRFRPRPFLLVSR